MLTRADVDLLLSHQSRAYGLLMWLADQANRDPEVLSPEATAALTDPDGAARWLKRHRDELPAQFLPGEACDVYASHLSSLFDTSFHVRHMEFGGRLVEARVTLGVRDTSIGGVEQCQALALQHLASAEKLRISEKEARVLVRQKALRGISLLWTYVWELDRRGKHKGKGTVAHRIWRALPKEARKTLNTQVVWDAREQLLGAVRMFFEEEPA